ncbi:MAG: hypothetical protein KDC27_17805 [Acidobacteria bacterium]|jgi:hypothetical protein|nr:hypothetical protein [Acidobacteriota bacterium]
MHQIYAELLFRARRPARELRDEIAKELQRAHAYFAWPTTEASSGAGAIDDSYFDHAQGVLGYLGYRVGMSGIPQGQRSDLLDHVYGNTLPPVNSREYMEQWGEPSTAMRLRKMAESLAAFARNAKRRNPRAMAAAIQDWEDDLRYLKKSYYTGRYAFLWPETIAK